MKTVINFRLGSYDATILDVNDEMLGRGIGSSENEASYWAARDLNSYTIRTMEERNYALLIIERGF
jgi:hypothetical protein